MGSIWTRPVVGPKAWRGADIVAQEDWIETLTADEIADVDRALRVARASGLPLEQIGREQFPLDVMRGRLASVLEQVYDGRGFAVLRGLPVADYADEDVGLILWGLGRYLGNALYQNPKGDLLGHVHDHGRTYGDIDVRGYETNAYLPYHTDGCDLVALLCLRRALEGGLSSIVSSVSVFNEIAEHHPEYLGLLFNGFYYIRREEALGTRGVSDAPVPVFGYADGAVSCRYLRNQINAGAVKRGVPLTPIEQEALDHFDSLTRDPRLRLDMDLQAGDIQLCNNYTTLHSRTGFVDGPEPHQKRHMLRLWLKFPKPWPVAPGFAEQMGYKPAGPESALVEA